MEKIVVDTSVVVKWFVDEDNSNEARKYLILQKNKKIQIYIPEALVLELVNALFYKGGFTKTELETVVEKLYSLELHFIALEKTIIKSCIFLMSKGQIASYDALFITIAKELNCKLITNDRKHHLQKIYKKIKYL